MHTNIFSSCYEYRLLMNRTLDECDKVSESLYFFKSPKTQKIYHVHVEMHPNHFYGIKFHLREHKNLKHKYNITTNLNEVRPIIFTCIKILLDINERDKRSSFGFIGSNTLFTVKRSCGNVLNINNEESMNCTARYRVYKRILLTFFTDEIFSHVQNEEHSAYLMVRRSMLDDNPSLIEDINDYFSENYDDFD